ncbi:hypothetical protein RB195_023642 [Necator americanus]|uniref:Peptidase A2 domain-containing protein n=1 Tax=Necator americanus TaxID=51031 RepID=A0ABR1EK50_NECAM
MTNEENVWNCNKREFEKMLVFFDSGAQKTVIEESLPERFGLYRGKAEICTISGIGGHIECFKSHIVHMRIGTAFGEVINMKIQTKPAITSGFPSVNLSPVDIEFLKENSICVTNKT